jgi:arylsulfatase
LAAGGLQFTWFHTTALCARTIPMAFSADEGLEIGQDLGSPSSPDYRPRGNEFSGTIACVQLDAGTNDHDHLVTPEERVILAVARQ